MKASVRLLPVVIFAASALLILKGIGLLTGGGYVLTGTNAALAAGAPAASAGSVAMPADAVLTDASPTLDDTNPTMETRASQAVAEVRDEASSEAVLDRADSALASTDPSVFCPPVAAARADAGAELPATGCAPSALPVSTYGDALPMVQDSSGNFVPLDAYQGDDSQQALIASLGARRTELDRREAEIDTRSALLEAAEKRLNERTVELAALEARVAQLVDEKQAAEDAGFKGVVSMYEAMKPKDAAKIFDTLNTIVLVKVARAMSPRKMSPILAAMRPEPAQKLTIALAASENSELVTASASDFAGLPQIVGQ